MSSSKKTVLSLALLLIFNFAHADELEFDSYDDLKLDLTLGLEHNSEILFTRTGDKTHAVPTDNSDLRFRAKAFVGLNFFRSKDSRFDFKGTTEYLYSNQAEYSFADPWNFNLTAPYEAHYSWGDLLLTPQYIGLLQDSNLNGNRDNVMNRYGLKISTQTSPSNTWDSEIYLNALANTTNDPVPAEDNAQGTYFAIGTLQSMNTGGGKTSFFEFLLEVSKYQSEGVNPKYNKVLIGIGYSDNFFLNQSSWTTRLETYMADFQESILDRKDSNTSLIVEIYKSISSNLDWGLKGSYATNTSENNSFDYNQWSSSTFITYNWIE